MASGRGESKFGESKTLETEECESKFGDGRTGKMSSYDEEESEMKHMEGKSSSRKRDEEDRMIFRLHNGEESSLMTKAMRYCFSHDFIGIFERYIVEHAYLFDDAVDNDEHKLEYHDQFKDYLVLFENTMEDWLAQENTTLAKFYEVLNQVQESGDSAERHFLKLLLASAEYDCFYDVMVTEARKQRNESR